MSNHRDSGARQEQNPLSFISFLPLICLFFFGGGGRGRVGRGSIPSVFGDFDKRRQNSGSFAAAEGVFTHFVFLTFILTFCPFD